MNWSADQQVLLGAMGYVLYRQAPAPVPPPADAAPSAPTGD